MNSWIVHVTDRKYMIKLQEKIKEDHLKSLKKRIKEREVVLLLIIYYYYLFEGF